MIKIKLERWNKNLVMQILDQDAEDEDYLPFTSRHGWTIEQGGGPGLFIDNKTIGVRSSGLMSSDDDDDVCVYNFLNNMERDNTFSEITQLFKEYKEHPRKYDNVGVRTIYDI